MNQDSEHLSKVGNLLVRRLERLSADSLWARRASGLRGSLLKCLASSQGKLNPANQENLKNLVSKGFEMLEKAAREIPDIEANLKEFE